MNIENWYNSQSKFIQFAIILTFGLIAISLLMILGCFWLYGLFVFSNIVFFGKNLLALIPLCILFAVPFAINFAIYVYRETNR